MPCDTTSYPHGTIPGERRYLNILGLADGAQCEDTCFTISTGSLNGEAESLENCNLWINGQCPGPFGCGGDINTFDYVAAGMVCEPCSVVCTVGESSAGCNWRTALSYCCVDGLIETADWGHGSAC